MIEDWPRQTCHLGVDAPFHNYFIFKFSIAVVVIGAAQRGHAIQHGDLVPVSSGSSCMSNNSDAAQGTIAPIQNQTLGQVRMDRSRCHVRRQAEILVFQGLVVTSQLRSFFFGIWHQVRQQGNITP